MKKTIFILGLSLLFGTQGYSQELYKFYDEASSYFGLMSSDTDEIVVSPKYDRIDDENEGFFRVAIKSGEGKYGDEYLHGFLDAKTGEEIIPCIYTDTQEFSDGLVYVWKQDDTELFVDSEGNEVLDHLTDKYFNVDNQFGNGLLSVSVIFEGFGYINRNDEIVIPTIYDDGKRFSEGLAPVKMDDLFGYIDTTGKLIIPYQFEDAYSFSNGWAKVEIDEKYGFIDKTGEVIIPIEYDWVGEFNGETASVELDGDYFYIDKDGNLTEQ